MKAKLANLYQPTLIKILQNNQLKEIPGSKVKLK